MEQMMRDERQESYTACRVMTEYTGNMDGGKLRRYSRWSCKVDTYGVTPPCPPSRREVDCRKNIIFFCG